MTPSRTYLDELLDGGQQVVGDCDDLDLFAGPGGWDTGHRLVVRGTRRVLGVEWDADACATGRANGHDRLEADVARLDPLEVAHRWFPRGVRLLIGSPPCGPFSAAGKALGVGDAPLVLTAVAGIRDLVEVNGLDEVGRLDKVGALTLVAVLDRLREVCADARSALVLEPLRWALLLRPESVALEQVPAVLPLWEACAEVLRLVGYRVATGNVTAEQYGVPQTRKRALLLASRVLDEVTLPAPTHSRYHPRSPDKVDAGLPRWVSMAEALGPAWRPEAANEGTTAADMAWVERRPSPTIVGSFAPDVVAAPGYRKAGDPPRQKTPGSVRVTLEQAATLQSFPPAYVFVGAEGAVFRQIGDAVPPLLAARTLEALGVGAVAATVPAQRNREDQPTMTHPTPTTPVFVAPDGTVTPSPVAQYVAAFPDAPSTPAHLAALAAQQQLGAVEVPPAPPAPVAPVVMHTGPVAPAVAAPATPVCGHDGTPHYWQPGCPGHPGTAMLAAGVPPQVVGVAPPVDSLAAAADAEQVAHEARAFIAAAQQAPQAFDLGAVAAQALEAQQVSEQQALTGTVTSGASVTVTPAAPLPTFAQLPVEVERHADGRPKILPSPDAMQAHADALAKWEVEAAQAKAEGREAPAAPKAPTARYYTRASSFGDCLEDTFNLERWKQRMVLLGVLESPDLLMSAAAFRHDKAELNEVVERALTLAKSKERAQLGTALHKVFETIDLGRDPGTVPERFVPDLKAYRDATAGWEYLGAETFVVCDELGLDVAGTFDRLRLVPPPPRSRRKVRTARIVDIKTGGSVEYSWLKFAVQLAVYAHGHRYNAATGARTPLAVLPTGEEVEVDLKVAEVVWVPAGEGRAEVFELNIEQGWTAAQIAKSVRGLRSGSKSWAKPAGKAEADLVDLIAAAPSLDELTALYTARGAEFTPEVQQVAQARWVVLSAGAA